MSYSYSFLPSGLGFRKAIRPLTIFWNHVSCSQYPKTKIGTR